MSKRLFISILISLLIFSGCAGPTTKTITPDDAAVENEAKKQREIALRELIKSHERLQDVSWPLLKAGLPLCVDRRSWSAGFSTINKYVFTDEMRDTAVSYLGLGDVIQVNSVSTTSPAEVAGLMKGDLLIEINNQIVPKGQEAVPKFKEVLKEETVDGKDLSLKVKRDGIFETIYIDPVEVCDYPVVLVNDTSVNAFADGNKIYVNQGMMDFARTDDELALVIGHELAHNNMRHIDAKRLNAMGGLFLDLLVAVLAGVDTGGMFSNAAAMAYSKEFEAEADYVGLYIVARADRDISEAPYFWRRMGVKHPGSINKNHAASHPSSPERFVAIEETIKEIENKHAASESLMPNIDEKKVQEREPPPSPML